MVTSLFVQENLKYHIHTSGIQRLAFAYNAAMVCCAINFFIELLINGILSNIEYKAFLSLGHGILILQHSLCSKNRKLTGPVSLVIGEILNLSLVYFTYILYPNYGIIWSQMSAYVIYYYQAFMIKSFSGCVIISVKQSAVWIFSGIYLQRINIEEPSVLLSACFSLFALMLSAFYFEYLKENDICLSKCQVKIMSEKMSLIVETIPDCISVISTDLIELFANSSVRHLTEKESIIDYLKLSSIVTKYEPFPKNNPILNDIKTALESTVGTTYSFGILEKDGNYIEWSGKIITWEENRAIILSGRNVTKIIRLEKENSENSYKSTLINTVSHELRTPTNAILTVGSLIKESKELSTINEERIDILLGSCSYQLCLINDLLDYAQIVAGSLKIFPVPFNFYEFLEDCTKFIELQLGNQIQLLKIVENVPDVIITDHNRIKQIILNLLSNARKFTLKGCITLEFLYSSPYLFVKCKDTGVGIPKEKVSKLFKHFGTLEESSSINQQGVGLGLVISNMLVHKLGGQGIKVESKEGFGSSFSFFIQIEELETDSSDVANEESHITIPTILVKSLQSKNEILIVDDVFFNIMAYIQIFKSEGILCSYALNGEEAIEKIMEKKFSCILMDCEMPILDGWETTIKLNKLKNMGEIISLPHIIGTTAHTDEGNRKKCFDAGMDDVILKPCSKETLINKVKNWILTE